ncbi:protein arginine N-methyltransferase 9-like [Ischnura elegans]|uniref:protein arginine N-methyltransferase 9-like n=1 Tax=Ischnura elegans TaxID=197161 RepID=UPI001ED87FEE|nr:protein arginine N-methyltransferase 9-like [Ischnura elegans]
MKPEARLEVANNSRSQAESYLSKNNPGRAFAHFLVALSLCPDWKEDLKSIFSSALCSWSTELESQKRYKDLFHCYEQALEVFPDCENILNNLGAHLYRLGHVREASHYFRKALMVDPEFLPARRNLQTVSNLVVERWHFRMLNDRLRNEAFREAIFKKVQQKFDNVLDIGTGTGILSMFAAKAGAQNVYSCEMSATMHQIAEDVIKRNNFSRKINLYNKSSYNLQIPSDIPERLSLVVTETMDCGLLGEHVLTILSDAWKRLLLPPCKAFLSNKKTQNPPGKEELGETSSEDLLPSKHTEGKMWNQCFWRYEPSSSSAVGHGIVIPFGASVCLAAIECHSLSLRYHLHSAAFVRQHLKFPETVIANYAGDCEIGDIYDGEDLDHLPGGFRYLGEAEEATYVNFNDPEEIEARLHGSFPSERLTVTASSSGRIDAVAAWFILDVDEDIKLVTAPGKGSCWEQAVFPLCPPLMVTEGQTIEYTVSNSGKKLAVSAKIVENRGRLSEAELADNDLHSLMENFSTSTISSPPLNENLFLPENVIALLNNNHWIKGLVAAAEKAAKLGKVEAVLDVSPFPVFGLFLMKMGAAERLVWCTSGEESQISSNELILKEVASLNGIKKQNVMCQLDPTMQGEFDVIYVDLVDSTGELQELAITKLPSLMQMLKPNGLILPERICVVAQLLFSMWLGKMSAVLSDENVCNYSISEFINVYKVSQHLDVDMNVLKSDGRGQPLQVLDLDIKNFSKTKYTRIVEWTVPEKCFVNAIAHWYEIKILDDIYVSSYGVDSHCKQVASLLPSEIEINTNEKLLVKVMHYEGLLGFQFMECALFQEDEHSESTGKKFDEK